MTFEALSKSIDAKKYASIYLLQGEATWHIDELTKKLENEIIDEGMRDFNLTVLYGRDSSLEAIISSARRAPMMSPLQVVIVKEMQLMKVSLEPLMAYISQPSPHTILVLQYMGKRMDGKLKTTKLLKKTDGVVIFDQKAIKEHTVPKWIIDRVQSFNLKIDERSAHMMAQYLGTDLNKVDNAIEKLKLNLPEGSLISEAHIERYVGISKDYNFFELENAISAKNLEKSFRIIAYAEKNPKAIPIQPVTTMLYRKFRDICIYHKNPSALKTAPFLKRMVEDAARKFSLKEAEQAIHILRRYDLRSKGVNNTGTVTGPLLMKEMVYELLC